MKITVKELVEDVALLGPTLYHRNPIAILLGEDEARRIREASDGGIFPVDECMQLIYDKTRLPEPQYVERPKDGNT